MKKQTQSITATLLTIAIAVVSWLIVQTKKKEHPPEVPPTGEKAPPPHAPGQSPPKTQDNQPYTSDSSLHVLMGDPSRSIGHTKDRNNYYMAKPYFALSYNNDKGGPNWVSWCLQKSDFGPGKRVEFFPDTTLPQGFKRVVPNDYTNSGFDRGHMCPRGDRTATQEMSTATFVMTNMLPQSPHLNQRGWNDLEDYSRDLAKHNNALYIVAGGEGVGGEGSMGMKETTPNGKVTVPAKCWKVILVVENGTGTADDIGKVGPTTRTIAIIMPNTQVISNDWPKYRVSVKDVETLTGYSFFDRVPAAIIDPLKAKVDATHIPPVRKTKAED